MEYESSHSSSDSRKKQDRSREESEEQEQRENQATPVEQGPRQRERGGGGGGALRHSQPRMQRRRIVWQRQSVHDSHTSFTSIPLSLSFSRPLLPLLPPSALATVGVAGARRSKGTEGARAGGVRSALASALCPSLGFTASASPLSSFSLSLTPYLCFTRLLHRHSLCSLDSLIAALDERRQGERGDTHDSRRRSVQRRRAACVRARVCLSRLSSHFSSVSVSRSQSGPSCFCRRRRLQLQVVHRDPSNRVDDIPRQLLLH